MDRLYKITVVMIAVLLVILGVSLSETTSHASSNHDYVSDMTVDMFDELVNSFKTFPQDFADALKTSYLNWDAVDRVLRKQWAETTSEERQELNNFLNWAYDYCLANDDVFSGALLRLGFFVKDSQSFMARLISYPAKTLRILRDLVGAGFRADGAKENKVYTVPSDFVNNVYDLTVDHKKASDDSLFLIFPSMTWGDVSSYLSVNQGKISAAYPKVTRILQYAWDNVAKSSPNVFYIQTSQSSGDTHLYDMGNVLIYYTYNNYNPPHYEISIPGGVVPRYRYSIKSDGTINCINDDSSRIDYHTGVEMPYFYQNLWLYIGFVTNDGRPIRVWRSQDSYNKSLDWSNGCPYEYLATDSYNNYDSAKDYSFSIQGDYLKDCNISNDYSKVVGDVTTNNDYSDHSVSNITNNYYTDTVGTNMELSDDFKPDDGSGEGDNLPAVGGDTGAFVQQVEDMGNFFPKLLEKLNVFKQFPTEVSNFMDVGLSWIPREDRALITAGIAAFILIGLWKLLWKG